MEIKFVTFKSKDNKEEMLSIFVLDDKGNEIDKYTFYNNKQEIDIEPLLKSSIQKLPVFLETIYQTGSSNEQIMFTSEEVIV